MTLLAIALIIVVVALIVGRAKKEYDSIYKLPGERE